MEEATMDTRLLRNRPAYTLDRETAPAMWLVDTLWLNAKFHNAQTLATGVLLGASTLFFTWRQSGDRKTNDLAAILFGGGYFWTQIAAGFFPGTAWKDPEFLQPGESLDEPFSPQDRMGLAATALVLLAGALMWPGKTAKVSASVDR